MKRRKTVGKTVIGWAMFGCLCLLMTGCPDKDGLDLPVGRYCYWDVPKGEQYKFLAAPNGPEVVDFIGRAYFAGHDRDCNIDPSKKHPLVIVAHGRIAPDVPKNYLGMTFLTNHLASWGDVVFSLNLDVVNALQGEETQWGIPHRGELILHAIEYMLAQNRDPSSRFFDRIDTTKIALVGHSRGGGAVIYACNYNQNHLKRPIKAVATLSPANFGTEPLQAPVPHLCLYGSWDGDLYEGQGPDLWARGTRRAARELVEIYGANHYFFSDHAYFAPESNEFGRKVHHLLAKGFVNAWFDRYLRDEHRYDWSDYLSGQTKLAPGLEYYISFQAPEYISISKGAEMFEGDGNSTPSPPRDTDPEMSQQDTGSAKSGAKKVAGQIQPVGLSGFCSVDLSGKPDYGVGDALKAGWDAKQDHLAFKFPPLDVGEYDFLCFRMSQVHGDPLNTVDFRKDFHVIVSDDAGHAAKVRLEDYLGGLQYPDLSGSLPPDDPNNRKQIMRSFRIPNSDLKGVDFSQVSQIVFVFDRPSIKGYDNASGSIKVTEIEFSK
jgi:hypothetical protein